MGIVRSAGEWARGRSRREGADAAPGSARARRARRAAFVALAVLVLVLAGLAVLGSTLAEEPVRRWAEASLNERISGYDVRIGRVDLQPLAFRVDVRDVGVAQEAHPEPAVAQVAEITASIEWRALLRGALVADVTLERPVLHVDRQQFRREAEDETPLSERGWQDAIQATVPLEINHVRVVDAELTYVDEGFEPLRVSAIRAEAANIRNVASPEREYPSTLAVDARVFEAGRLALRGDADFLAKPQPGVRAELELEGIELDYLQPLLTRQHFEVRGGRLALAGEFEVGRTVQRVELRELVVSDLAGDYVRSEASEAKEPAAVREVARAAEQATARPELQLRAERIALHDANVGMRSVQEAGPYRVFLSELELELENFSNRFQEGTGHARLSGRFMGSGATHATATFEPEREGPEFELALEIVDTELRAMNELLRAYGQLDVTRGLFSLYSEIRVADGRIDGYVKPLFRDVEVYDPAQDEDDGLLRQAYEGVAGAVSELLENPPREEVATTTDLSGPVENPETDTWELLVRLVQNAFVRAILPGFERQLGEGD